MNDLNIQKTEVTEVPTSQESSEKVINKEILNGYLFGDKPYSL
jgi:hypothetical protein